MLIKKIPLVPFVGMVYMLGIGTATLFGLGRIEDVFVYGTMAGMWVGGVCATYYHFRNHSRIVWWLLLVIVAASLAMRAVAYYTMPVDQVMLTLVLWVSEGPFFLGGLLLLHRCLLHLFATPDTKAAGPAAPSPPLVVAAE